MYFSCSFLRPVPGPFPLLLHLPNGQTMPVAIPASITNSNVHVPAAVPVSLHMTHFTYLFWKTQVSSFTIITEMSGRFFDFI